MHPLLIEFTNLIQAGSVEALIKTVHLFITLAFSAVLFVVKLKDRTQSKKPQLAYSMLSADKRTGFVLVPDIPYVLPPIFHIRDTEKDRSPGEGGWLTVTNIRIWNAGGDVIVGSQLSAATTAFITIPSTSGRYVISDQMSNDPELRFRIGRPTRKVPFGGDKLPIYFDILRGGKGILLCIYHNERNDDDFKIELKSNQSPISLRGITYPFRAAFVNMAIWLAGISVLPFVILAIYFYLQSSWWSLLFCYLSLVSIGSVYFHRRSVKSPKDLTWNKKT